MSVIILSGCASESQISPVLPIVEEIAPTADQSDSNETSYSGELPKTEGNTEAEQPKDADELSVSIDTSGTESIEEISTDSLETETIGEIVNSSSSKMDSLKTVPNEQLVALMQEASSKYYYQKLTDHEKMLYAQILYILRNFEEDVCVDSLDVDELDRVFRFVIYDYPEIFYVEGCSYVKYQKKNQLIQITLSGMYTYSREQVENYAPSIKAYKDAFATFLNTNYPGSGDSYTIIKAAYEFIILNTTYDLNAPDNQNIISVICNGRSVCLGITKTFKMLMDTMGIESAVVSGSEKGGAGHAWNLVKSNGDYYFVDATWGGQSYRFVDGNVDASALPKVTYDFLMVDEAFLLKTHTMRDPEMISHCVATADNYYVREGLLFDSVDVAKLTFTFESAYLQGRGSLTIKMSDSNVYADMRAYLLTDQHIFDLLHGKNSVTYVESPDLNTMTFWLN